jgi:hypothetical protein
VVDVIDCELLNEGVGVLVDGDIEFVPVHGLLRFLILDKPGVLGFPAGLEARVGTEGTVFSHIGSLGVRVGGPLVEEGNFVKFGDSR